MSLWCRPSSVLATWFGAGLMPAMPGTWGTLAAVPFAAIIQYLAGETVLLAAAGGVVLIGIWACERYIQHLGVDDPPSAVIDEVAGQWIVLSTVPLTPLYYLAAFILFRIFDILKPWPISWLDRHLKGGFGTMVDDVIAAIYAALVILPVRLILEG